MVLKYKIPNLVPMKKHPNLLIVFKQMLFILLFCGFDYNFYKCSRMIKIIIKFYCITISVLIFIASIFCCPGKIDSNILSIIEYMTSVHILIFIRDETYVFFQKLQRIDVMLMVPQSYYGRTKLQIFVWVFFLWLIRIAFTTSYCTFYVCFEYITLYFFDCFALLSLDINRAWRYLIFDIIRYRLKMLRIKLEESTENIFVQVIEKNKFVNKEKLKGCLNLYKEIADTMAVINPILQGSVSNRLYFFTENNCI